MSVASEVITPSGVARIASGGKWKPARHLLHLNRYLMRAAGGFCPRLQCNMPPKHGKTQFIAEFFPLFFLGTFPTKKILYATATDRMGATQGLKARLAFERYGPALFGSGVWAKKSSEDWWWVADSKGKPTDGQFRTVGAHTDIHGYGADLIILDDVVGNVKEITSPTMRESLFRWYTSTIRTRAEDEGVVVVNLGTPFHSDDLFARLQKSEDQGGQKWHRLRFPALAQEDDPLGRKPGEALWPERWSQKYLEDLRDTYKADGQFRDWQAQYQLTPVSGDGVTEWEENLFDSIYYDAHQRPAEIILRILGIDTSEGRSEASDYQAFTLVQLDDRGHHWVECFMCRKDEDGLYAQALELIKLWRPDMTVVETNGSGHRLWVKLNKAHLDGVNTAALGRCHGGNKDNKYQRLKGLGSYLHKGTLHIARSPGGRLLVEQLRVFPHGDHDDGPDALEMALEYCVYRRMPKDHPLREQMGRDRWLVPQRAA